MSMYIGLDKVKKVFVGTNEVKKIYIGTDLVYSKTGGRLPVDYQEVEWISQDGSGQYIELDYKPYATSDVEIDCEYTPKSGIGSSTFIFSADDYKLNTPNARVTNVMFGNGTSNNTTTQYLLIGGQSRTFNYTFTGRTNVHLTNKKIYIDNIEKTTCNGTFSDKSLAKLWLGGQRSDDVVSAVLKIYSCKIKDTSSSNLALDLVPCYEKATGTIGLYDLVNDEFYTNSGSGTFTKGDDI